VTPTLLFIHLGPDLPPWLLPTLHQARIFNSCPVLLVAEREALERVALPDALQVTQVPLQDLGISIKQHQFREISPLDRDFRAGFWTYTSERFFVVESVMVKFALEHVVHMENDVLLYCSLDELVPRLSRLYRGAAATFDNDVRCVPGIVYFPHRRAAGALTDFLIAALRQVAAHPEMRGINDMALLGAFRAQGREAIDHLPIVPPDYPGTLRSAVGHAVADPACYWRNFETLEMVFDAAALGQFLGGVDPRNTSGVTTGFVNESCVFDPRMLRPHFVRNAQGRRVPVVETRSGLHAIANLHIHSKNPTPFLSA
jgi:hypothetical protein